MKTLENHNGVNVWAIDVVDEHSNRCKGCMYTTYSNSCLANICGGRPDGRYVIFQLVTEDEQHPVYEQVYYEKASDAVIDFEAGEQMYTVENGVAHQITSAVDVLRYIHRLYKRESASKED